LKIKIQYFAIVRELVGQREEVIDLERKTNVLDLLKLLGTRHGEKFMQYVFDPATGNPRLYLQFLVNQESISSLSGFSTILPEDSTFAIIPPVGGG
jgi:MoaD family protein